MKILAPLQRTPEWHQARLGKATGSRMADMTATLKNGAWGASRERYMGELFAERMTGQPSQGYLNEDMQHGIGTEPAAREAYTARHFREVEEVGFLDHPKIFMSGCSPDGLVGDDLTGNTGTVEFKCPATHTHLATMETDAIPEKYLKQVQWGLAVTGRAWCDWCSFDPRLPERYQLYVKRIMRDPAMILYLEKQTVQFLKELDEKIARIEKKYGLAK